MRCRFRRRAPPAPLVDGPLQLRRQETGFRCWYGDHYNKEIKALYDEVYEPGAINPGLPESYLDAAEQAE